jgi:alkanesulfonate monooxygenase SsuD/methylene tetrahydromethanopterin reductase-like flavin-dependent oxidoreductase (luciferase family)
MTTNVSDAADSRGPAANLEVGIFDWIDASDTDPADIYERHLRVAEFADQAGFERYHVAEHHGTPLGMAGSPNVFLAAAAVRTSRIRLGPLVTLPPVFHPLRQLEETAMLDQLSHGRYDLGVGRGAISFELAYFGVDVADTRELLDESLAILIQGFTTGKVDHAGKHYRIKDYRVQIPVRQRPYPPLWYATRNAQTMPWLGQNNVNVVSWALGGDPSPGLQAYRVAQAAYRDDPQRLNAHVAQPRVGLMGHIYVADTDEQARREVREALQVWGDSFNQLWVHHQGQPRFTVDLDAMIEQNMAIVGSPASACLQAQRWLDSTGANLIDGAFAFGNLSTEQILHSLDLFNRDVRPSLQMTVTR